jgi:hypothetical protein
VKKIFTSLGSIKEKGQGLVEMAIVTPILIFMLLGVFEVGWALRGYLVLTNVNREITRFAIRPNYLSYTVKNNNPPTATFPITPAYVSVGYNQVLSYTYETLSNQLPMIFSSGVTSSTMIISHMVIDTGLPCKEGVNCKCNDFVTVPSYISSTDVLTLDDLILHPGVPGYEYFYSAKFPLTSTRVTKFNYEQEALNLKKQNNKFNCELMNKSTSTIPSANNVIFTEIYYNQPQIFGFPLISNPLTDPVPMYAHTAMRMIVASRSGENVDTVGPVCIAIPFTIRNTQVNTATVGSTVFDIMGGEAPAGVNDQGFLAWLPQWQNVPELDLEFSYPRSAFNSYTNAKVSSDHSLSVGDYVKSLPGNNNAIEIRDHIDALIASGEPVIIPVWDQWDSGTSSFHISTFIKVRLISNPVYHLTTNNPEVWAVYDGPATECLQ